MKKLFFLLLLSCLFAILLADASDDWLWQEEQQDADAAKPMAISEDLIKLNTPQKDARLAMLYSMVLPGAGQFYADRSAFTTYIFPVIEVGLIAGNILYHKRGDKKTEDFERYATGEEISYTLGNGVAVSTKRYVRSRQDRVQNILIELVSADIYDSGYFRLDKTDTQHFYEDIGKYKHYVFGWADWYYHFATNESGMPADPIWYPQPETNNPGWIWEGNYPLWDDAVQGLHTTTIVYASSHQASPMRKKYISMRNDAKADYYSADRFLIGLAFNHIAAGMDAIRVTRNANKGRPAQIQYQTTFRDNRATPLLNLSWSF